MDHIVELRDTDRGTFNDTYRFGEFFLFGHDRWNALNADAWAEAVRQPMEWGRGQLRPQFIIENINPDWGTNEARSLDAINTEWDRVRIELVRSSDDAAFDAILESYENFLNSNNWERILEIRNAGIERNRNRLDRY
jgi:putative aldouronate transport system substrate-binding protein